MTILAVVGLLSIISLGIVFFLAGIQMCVFMMAFSSQHSPMGYFVIAAGVFCFWLAYYLSPFAFAVKVIA